MKKIFFSARGVTILEVTMAAAIFGVVLMVALQLSDLRTGLTSRTRTSYSLSEIVMDNVIEAKAKDIKKLTPGKCIIRYYANGFDKEKIADNSSTECGKNNLDPNQTQIVWKVKGPDEINHAFTPSEFLKLPKYKITVLQVEIYGRTRIGSSRKIESAGTLIFKR